MATFYMTRKTIELPAIIGVGLNCNDHWRTRQQRLIRVSSTRITSVGCVLLLALTGNLANAAPQGASGGTANARPAGAKAADPATLFQRGEEALKQNRLDEAEHEFREVLLVDPQAGPAYGNLGVVYMR